MSIWNGTFLEDLCPKVKARRWRQTLHELTAESCIYCGKPSKSIDHIHPRSKGGATTINNCAPACLTCNGKKSNEDPFEWYRRQDFYEPRRAMAIRAWLDGDLQVAVALLN